MQVTHLPAGERQPQPWRNGGGMTFEIARAPHLQRSRDFLWRVSIADVATAGPFSRFDGCERLIAVIAGAGMRLRGLAPDDTLLVPFSVVRFDGALAVEGLLPHGPVRDLNVIFDPALCSAQLAFVDDNAGRVLAARTAFLVNLDAARCEWRCGSHAGALSRFDAVQFGHARNETLEWRGSPRLALVEIDGMRPDTSDPTRWLRR